MILASRLGRGDWYRAGNPRSRLSPLLANRLFAFSLDLVERLEETIMFLRGYLRRAGVQFLRPLTNLGLGVLPLGLLDNQFLAFTPTRRERLDGLNNAMAQDSSNGHIVSSIQHIPMLDRVNSHYSDRKLTACVHLKCLGIGLSAPGPSAANIAAPYAS